MWLVGLVRLWGCGAEGFEAWALDCGLWVRCLSVHRDRLGLHGRQRGVVVDTLPAAQAVRDAEAEWIATARNSYKASIRNSWVSIRAQWVLWLRPCARAPPPDTEIVLNPEVRRVCAYCGYCMAPLSSRCQWSGPGCAMAMHLPLC